MRISLPFFLLIASCAQAQLVPFGFEPNDGQYPAEVKFFRRQESQAQTITRDSMVLINGIRIQIADVPQGNTQSGVLPRTTIYNNYASANPSQWKQGSRQYDGVQIGEISPGVRASFNNSQSLDVISTQIGNGVVQLNASPGADLSRFRVKFLNTGTSAMLGPGGVWFTGGRVPGVFTVRASIVQLRGAERIPGSIELVIESADTLSIRTTGVDATLESEIQIQFPNYELTPRWWLAQGPYVQSGFGSANDAPWVARLDSSGSPVWVTMLRPGTDTAGVGLVESPAGIVWALATTAPDFPVSSNAPYPKPTGPRDLYLALLDPADGKLRNASYGGFTQGISFGQAVAFGATDVVVGGGLTGSGGYITRWQISSNRRVFTQQVPSGVRTLVVDSRSRIHYAAVSYAPAPSEMTTGVLREDGTAEGSVARTLPPVDLPSPDITNPRILPLSGDEYVATYTIWPRTEERSWTRTVVAGYSTRGTTSTWSRDMGSGIDWHSMGVTPAGNPKFLFRPYGPAQPPTTTRAKVVALCPERLYFGIVSRSGALLHADFVPVEGFQLDQENEPVQEPSASVTCVARTAGRMPAAAVAPGQLITITGGGFGPAVPSYAAPDASGRYPTTFEGFEVRISGTPVPLIAVARGLIAVQVPYNLTLASQEGTVEVIDRGTPLNSIPIRLATHSFSLFTTGDIDPLGYPRLAALNQDGSVNSRENPAARGSVVSLFGSGLGRLTSSLETGGLNPIPPAGPLGLSELLRVAMGGSIEYLGTAPGLSTGVSQINIRLNDGPTGTELRSERIGVAVAESIRQLFLFDPAGVIYVR